MRNRKNLDIKILLLQTGITQLELSQYLGVSYTTLRNRLRFEMSDDEKKKYKKYITTLSKQNARTYRDDKKVPQFK